MTALLARWTEKLAGGPQAGTSDPPPLARVMGVGRQQQHDLEIKAIPRHEEKYEGVDVQQMVIAALALLQRITAEDCTWSVCGDR